MGNGSRTIEDIKDAPSTERSVDVLIKASEPSDNIQAAIRDIGANEVRHLAFRYYSATVDESLIGDLIQMDQVEDVELEMELENLQGNFGSRSGTTL